MRAASASHGMFYSGETCLWIAIGTQFCCRSAYPHAVTKSHSLQHGSLKVLAHAWLHLAKPLHKRPPTACLQGRAVSACMYVICMYGCMYLCMYTASLLTSTAWRQHPHHCLLYNLWLASVGKRTLHQAAFKNWHLLPRVAVTPHHPLGLGLAPGISPHGGQQFCSRAGA